MTNETLYEVLGGISERHVDEARAYHKAKKPGWIKWGTMAACLCLILAGALTLPHLMGNDTPGTPPIAAENAYGFTMEGSDVLYLPISFAQRKAFGLIDENATGLTDENTYQITDDDLGGVMGMVGDSRDESIIGEAVYHFIKFPSDDAICIVRVNGIYQFYVKEGVAGIEGTDDPDQNMDAPAEENTCHETEPDTSAAETYNEAITLEYITELQANVSAAMRNGDLPFVSSSAVYENPYRLHVVVTSNAENDLSKLKAFDTLGGALEIEYAAADHIVTE